MDPLGCGLSLLPSSGGGAPHHSNIPNLIQANNLNNNNFKNSSCSPSPASASPLSTTSSTRSYHQHPGQYNNNNHQQLFHHTTPSASNSTWSSSSSSSMGPPVTTINGSGGGVGLGPSSNSSNMYLQHPDSINSTSGCGTLERGTAFKIHLNTSYRHIKYGDGIDVKVSS